MLAVLETEDSKIKFSNFTFQIWDSIPGDFDMGVDYIHIVKNIVLKHVPQDEFAVFLFGSRAPLGMTKRYLISMLEFWESDLFLLLLREF